MKEALIAASGIIFFLVGMIRLSAAVRRMINARIKELVRYAVEKPLYGLVTGIASAIVLQSSSATTALTIGLVSAGLISFYSSLAIILGADIGTTLTVQFVIWRFTEFSPFIVTIGGLLWLTRRGKWKAAGEMIFYFGLIFFGLKIISQTAQPLRQSPAFIHCFHRLKILSMALDWGWWLPPLFMPRRYRSASWQSSRNRIWFFWKMPCPLFWAPISGRPLRLCWPERLRMSAVKEPPRLT